MIFHIQTKNYEASMKITAFCAFFLFLATAVRPASQDRPRLREFGIKTGVLEPGLLNAITDVAGVKVGHVTLIEGKDVRTGVTAILPHDGNVFQEKVPAAVYIANAFGKLTGSTQVEELGNIETPIILTNTLSVPTAADAVIDYILGLPENKSVQSVNPVVGETNDGRLNDIRGRHVKKEHVLEAIKNAKSGPVEEGASKEESERRHESFLLRVAAIPSAFSRRRITAESFRLMASRSVRSSAAISCRGI
jgi:D-aminopeptidase